MGAFQQRWARAVSNCTTTQLAVSINSTPLRDTGEVPPRETLEITDVASRLVFRFYFERSGALHITRRWGVSPETAISVFFDDTVAPVWVDWRRCWETRTPRYTLAWLWMDEAHTRVLVITCVDKERIA